MDKNYFLSVVPIEKHPTEFYVRGENSKTKADKTIFYLDVKSKVQK
jgi:hypothetical protein